MRRLLVAVAALGIGYATLSVFASDAAGSSGSPDSDGYTHYADDTFPHYEPGQLPGGVGAQAVIGGDERIRITDTDVYPWRAIAWIGLYDDAEEFVGSCTGTFIGPDALLTAGHCLYTAGEGFIGDIVVVPGKDATFEPYGYEFASSWWVPDQWIESGGDPEWDWGVIALDSVTLGNTVGWFRVADLTSQSLERSDFTPAIVGYPGDKTPEASMWGSLKDSLLEVQQFELAHDIDTYPGQSGSALFSGNLDSPYLGLIVGIHTYGTPTANFASRIDEVLLDDLLTGCEVMGCSIAYYIEPRSPSHTATQVTFCRSDANCSQGSQTLAVGQQAWLRFNVQPVPTEALDGEVYWNGSVLKRVVWQPPPYGAGAFNLQQDILGKPAAAGEFEVRLWVGGQYIGSVTATVAGSLATATPTPTPTKTPTPTVPRPFRAITGGISKD